MDYEENYKFVAERQQQLIFHSERLENWLKYNQLKIKDNGYKKDIYIYIYIYIYVCVCVCVYMYIF